ncbi:MAG: rhomboid family intramembrane serine protease [Chitinophagaceae bacterium]
MELVGFISLLIIIITSLVSYKGLTNHAFYDKYSFGIDKVLVQKDYKVIVTSGFLHVSWLHLIFNMFSLYMFSQGLEGFLGPAKYLLIYFASMIGGNLFTLFVHRQHADYSAVGASGAVSGLIFASIAINPAFEIGLFGILFIPAWLYGVLFVAYSIYGIRSRKDNLGHEAHLAGALIGMITAIILFPQALMANYVTILLLLVPSLIFIFFIIRKPSFLLVDNQFFRSHEAHTIDDRYNIAKHNRQKEIDRILEKIHQKGMGSLSKKEKDFLNGK